MKCMEILIFSPLPPAPVRFTYRMKFMRKQHVQAIDHYNVDVHHAAAGYSQIDLFDGWPRCRGHTFWGGPAECAGPMGGISEGFSFILELFNSPIWHALHPRNESQRRANRLPFSRLAVGAECIESIWEHLKSYECIWEHMRALRASESIVEHLWELRASQSIWGNLKKQLNASESIL